MPDTDRTGEMYGINVPGIDDGAKLVQSEATDAVGRYRWIYVNASLKDVEEAKAEGAKLSNALGGRPMVLVYISRTVFDGQRNDYPAPFLYSMSALIDSATQDSTPLLVCGRSYGVHQALHAAHQFNKPSILVMGIAPAFGAFGNGFSDNVKTYISEVRTTQCKYGMIASKKDTCTWKSGGAAYKRKYTYRGDNDLGRAADANAENVHIEVLDKAKHFPIDQYLNNKLVRAMQRTVSHFEMEGLSDIVNGTPV